ncbi:neuropeptides capa receptor isoform X2 [Planococcus citri]|uniref:neuropeptides capa receptor isoform X2 n=1 Tax=Planococcus citri TaxID=170843 RepID=UPI0031F8C821
MINGCTNGTNCESYVESNHNTTLVSDEEQNIYAQASQNIAVAILQFLQLYYTPVLVILGCVGNTLSVFVFFGTKLKKLSSSYYLAALAISDSGFLIAQFVTWLNLVHVPLFNKAGFCQMAIYFSHICSFLSVWLVVLFTIERFIAVRYPLHRPAVCTVARAKLFISCLTMIALPTYGPYFIIAAPQMITDTNNNKTVTMQVCTLVPQWIDLASVLNHIDFFLTLILPFCTIVVLNTLICRTVHRLGRVRRTMTLTTRKRFLNRAHSRRSTESHISRTFSHRTSAPSQSKVTQMLLVVSTVFICLNLPSYLLRIWVYVNKKSDPMANDDIVMVLLQHYSNILFATNFGINFVLYCISGQNFRKALCSLFCPKRVRRKQEHTQATGPCPLLPDTN